MSEAFDRDYWEKHWRLDPDRRYPAAHPALDIELADLAPGVALDAGCGEGAEAIWLATRGWAVTGADISARALQRARARAAAEGVAVEWLEIDLGATRPDASYDLVTTFYAHPDIPYGDFLRRLGGLVRGGGTLLVLGHGPSAGAAGHHDAPTHASLRVDAVVADLVADGWRIETAEERDRVMADPHGRPTRLRDVVVRAVKGSAS